MSHITEVTEDSMFLTHSFVQHNIKKLITFGVTLY